jgi:MSHA biogenesis protein MshL
VPGVGAIPFLGSLFGQERKANVRSELVILLKPIVVNSSATWSDYIRQSQQRIEGMRRAPASGEQEE